MNCDLDFYGPDEEKIPVKIITPAQPSRFLILLVRTSVGKSFIFLRESRLEKRVFPTWRWIKYVCEILSGNFVSIVFVLKVE